MTEKLVEIPGSMKISIDPLFLVPLLVSEMFPPDDVSWTQTQIRFEEV